MSKPLRSGDALLKAERARAVATRNPDDPLARIEARRAERVIEEINTRLPEGAIDVGMGGELAVIAPGAFAGFMNTVKKPNAVSRQSRHD